MGAPVTDVIQSSPTLTEKRHMSIKVTNPTFINGVNADGVSNDVLLDTIATAQKQVTRLKGMGVKSKTVDAMIAKEEDGIKAAIDVLDSREI